MSDRGLLLLQGGRVTAADGEYDADELIEGHDGLPVRPLWRVVGPG